MQMEKLLARLNTVCNAADKLVIKLKEQEIELEARSARIDERTELVATQEREVQKQADALNHLGSLEQERKKSQKAFSKAVKERNRLEGLLVEIENKSKEADAKLDSAQQVEADILATRARLRVEVKRVEERKANLKQEIMAELAGGA